MGRFRSSCVVGVISHLLAIAASSGLRGDAPERSLQSSGPYVLSPDNDIISCVGGKSFRAKLESECSYEGMIEAMSARMERLPRCNLSPEEELSYLLKANSTTEAGNIVRDLCNDAVQRKSNHAHFPFGSITQMDHDFNKEFFDGGTFWNEGGGKPKRTNSQGHLLTGDKAGNSLVQGGSNAFRGNARRVDAINRVVAKKRVVSWPDDLPNFENCHLNAAMCCWVDDGVALMDDTTSCDNCTTPTPADNADVCLVDLRKSPASNHVHSGFTIFQGDEPTFCHGFAWGKNDWNDIFKGNNLFHTSLFENMHKRGLARNVPGAPMCGCLEQMPIVTRADCTEIKVVHRFLFMYDAINHEAKLDMLRFEVEYHPCIGTSSIHNDLSAFYDKLHQEGATNSTQKQDFDKIVVGEGNCPSAVDGFLAAEGFAKTI